MCLLYRLVRNDGGRNVWNQPGDRTDAQLLGKFIVILAHPEQMIGVIASNVTLITIPEESISVDSLTGARTFAENSNIFAIVDIKNLFRDEGYDT